MLDRYTAGGPVTRDELRHVWEDTTQISGVWSLPMYEQMLAEVRSVNERLPPATRIRVIAGDPPIDWDHVLRKEDHRRWTVQRDSYPADLIRREVVVRGRRALVVYGNLHFLRREILSTTT